MADGVLVLPAQHVTDDAQVAFSLAKASVPVRTDADVSKFAAKTGWAPKIPLQTTLKDLLDYWRALV